MATGAIPYDLLLAAGTGLRALTLPAGLLVGGGAGAAAILQRLGIPAATIAPAACRLARPLVAGLLLAALPLAVVETLLETRAPLDALLFTDLLPYTLANTLFGVVWAAHLLVLAILALRLRAGHAPGLLGSSALLAAWPQLTHLLPNFAIAWPETWVELGAIAAHRVGAACWLGSLAVLLLWSRPGGPAARPWGRAFARLALPGAALLLAGASSTILTHGGAAALTGPSLFAHLVQIKIGLLAALLLLGAGHFRRYRHPLVAPTRGTLLVEIGTALAAVLLGALLGVLPSPGS
ncbi:MAG TPA: hypothetical protein VKY74_20790 [Chloroflexia bacterium]|nr:hypothetical protein [Chloroflexia bacterium]